MRKRRKSIGLGENLKCLTGNLKQDSISKIKTNVSFVCLFFKDKNHICFCWNCCTWRKKNNEKQREK